MALTTGGWFVTVITSVSVPVSSPSLTLTVTVNAPKALYV
jgi:hypothetical protein